MLTALQLEKDAGGTVNKYGYVFSNGVAVMAADDGCAYSKADFGFEDVVREVVDLVSSDEESGDEEDEESADEEDEESADDDEEDEESAAPG